MGTKMFSVRLDEDLIARLEGVGEKRSDFVRAAIEAALGVGGLDAPVAAKSVKKVDMASAPKKNSIAVPVEKATSVSGFRVADEEALVALLRKRPLSSRDAERSMAWLGLRYPNAEKALLSSGRVAVVDGLLVVTE